MTPIREVTEETVAALKPLSPAGEKIIRLLHGLYLDQKVHTREQLAEELDVSVEAIRYVEERMMRLLRNEPKQACSDCGKPMTVHYIAACDDGDYLVPHALVDKVVDILVLEGGLEPDADGRNPEHVAGQILVALGFGKEDA